MMKKFLSLFLALLLAFSAVACNGEGDVTTDAPKETDPPAPDTTAAPVAPETTETIQEDKTMKKSLFISLLIFFSLFSVFSSELPEQNGIHPDW